MDSAIAHVLYFQWSPSKYGFSSMSASGGWKEGSWFTELKDKKMMAHLPPEMFFGGHDTDGDGKADFEWLDKFVLSEFVANADWEFVDGIKIEDIPYTKEVAVAHGYTWSKDIPAHTTYQILKYPDNPKAGYIDLVLGANLFLKAAPNAFNKGYPMYELYYRQGDVGQVYWGQLKKLTTADGEPMRIDIGEHFEKLNKERFQENLLKAKETRLNWLDKNAITWSADGKTMYIGGKIFTPF